MAGFNLQADSWTAMMGRVNQGSGMSVVVAAVTSLAVAWCSNDGIELGRGREREWVALVGRRSCPSFKAGNPAFRAGLSHQWHSGSSRDGRFWFHTSSHFKM